MDPEVRLRRLDVRFRAASCLRGQEAPPRAVELASDRFRSHEHATSGRAAVAARRRAALPHLTSLATSAGSDLRVRLAPSDTSDAGADGAIDLGALKGNRD